MDTTTDADRKGSRARAEGRVRRATLGARLARYALAGVTSALRFTTEMAQPVMAGAMATVGRACLGRGLSGWPTRARIPRSVRSAVAGQRRVIG